MPATGPVTESGKAASSRNAVKHGILSEATLVTPLEKAVDWQSHLAAVRSNLAPRDHLETCLAERIALLLWRMRRLACAEVEAIAWSQARVANDYPTEEFDGCHPSPIYEYVSRLRSAERLHSLWTSLWETPDEQWLVSSTAADLLKQAMALGGVKRDQAPPGLHQYWDWSKEVWTAARLRSCLDWIVSERELDTEQFRGRCLEYFNKQVDSANAVIDEIEQDLDRMARRRMLPPESEMQLQTRYEAHLGRELSRTLRALRELQSGPIEQPKAPKSESCALGDSEMRTLNGSTPFLAPESSFSQDSITPSEITALGITDSALERTQANCETNPEMDCAPFTPPIQEVGGCQRATEIYETDLELDGGRVGTSTTHTPSAPQHAGLSGEDEALAADVGENYETNSTRQLTPDELDASFYPPAPSEEELKGLNSGQLARIANERIQIYLENKRKYEETLQAKREEREYQ